MKKFLVLIIALLFFSGSDADAKSLRVLAMQNFSTSEPASTFVVQTTRDEILPNKIFLQSDTLISGSVYRVATPKRGKRNGYIEFVPQKFIYRGNSIDIQRPEFTAIITYYRPIDPKDLALNVVRKTANIMFHGVVSAAQFAQGVVENEEGNRIKSGVMNVYRDSFLSYIEVGEELNVRRGDLLIFKMKRVRTN